MREHATSVHLMLDPTDASQVDIDARQHPDLPGSFYVDVDSPRCHIAPSGQAEPLLGVVERNASRSGRHPGRGWPLRPHPPARGRARHRR